MISTAPELVFLAALFVIGLGYILRKSGLLNREDGSTVAKIVLNVTLPAVILETVPAVELSPSLIFLPVLAILHALVVFPIVQLLFRRRSMVERGVITICSIGFNNGLFAFPIVRAIWGGEAVKLLAIFDVGNALVLLGGCYVIASYYGQGGALDLRGTLRVVGRSLVTSVPLITLTVALLINVSGVVIPAPIEGAIGMVASANGALALLVLGIFQSLSFRREEIGTIFKVLSLRYILGILFAIGAVWLLGETLLYRRILSIVFILPIGMSVIPYSVAFGLDTRLATTMVNVTILLSFVLMWIAVAVVG